MSDECSNSEYSRREVLAKGGAAAATMAGATGAGCLGYREDRAFQRHLDNTAEAIERKLARHGYADTDLTISWAPLDDQPDNWLDTVYGVRFAYDIEEQHPSWGDENFNEVVKNGYRRDLEAAVSDNLYEILVVGTDNEDGYGKFFRDNVDHPSREMVDAIDLRYKGADHTYGELRFTHPPALRDDLQQLSHEDGYQYIEDRLANAAYRKDTLPERIWNLFTERRRKE